MGLFDGLSKKFKKAKETTTVTIDIRNKRSREMVEFILFSLPQELIKGIEIIEKVFDVDAQPHQIIVKSTMSPTDIKREIGKYVFRTKRWKEQEEISTRLLASGKVDRELIHQAYNTEDSMKVYEIVNADVFAVYYGTPTMTLDEVGIAINSLYLREAADKDVSKKMQNFVDDLFDKKN